MRRINKNNKKERPKHMSHMNITIQPNILTVYGDQHVRGDTDFDGHGPQIVLPEHLSENAELSQRFGREARRRVSVRRPKSRTK
jgi:hypothetical protein